MRAADCEECKMQRIAQPRDGRVVPLPAVVDASVTSQVAGLWLLGHSEVDTWRRCLQPLFMLFTVVRASVVCCDALHTSASDAQVVGGGCQLVSPACCQLVSPGASWSRALPFIYKENKASDTTPYPPCALLLVWAADDGYVFPQQDGAAPCSRGPCEPISPYCLGIVMLCDTSLPENFPEAGGQHDLSLSLHCTTIALHYPCIALPLHCIVPALHCPCTTPALHCPCTTPALHCPCTTPALSLHYPCTTPTLPLHYPCTTLTPPFKSCVVRDPPHSAGASVATSSSESPPQRVRSRTSLKANSSPAVDGNTSSSPLQSGKTERSESHVHSLGIENSSFLPDLVEKLTSGRTDSTTQVGRAAASSSLCPEGTDGSVALRYSCGRKQRLKFSILPQDEDLRGLARTGCSLVAEDLSSLLTAPQSRRGSLCSTPAVPFIVTPANIPICDDCSGIPIPPLPPTPHYVPPYLSIPPQLQPPTPPPPPHYVPPYLSIPETPPPSPPKPPHQYVPAYLSPLHLAPSLLRLPELPRPHRRHSDVLPARPCLLSRTWHCSKNDLPPCPQNHLPPCPQNDLPPCPQNDLPPCPQNDLPPCPQNDLPPVRAPQESGSVSWRTAMWTANSRITHSGR
ncbi:hypothetical protein FHG87_022102, partial [Trinorchestia longiramus]